MSKSKKNRKRKHKLKSDWRHGEDQWRVAALEPSRGKWEFLDLPLSLEAAVEFVERWKTKKEFRSAMILHETDMHYLLTTNFKPAWKARVEA